MNYKNQKDYFSSMALHSNLFSWAFLPSYICLIKLEERGAILEYGEEEDDDTNILEFL